MPGPRTTLETTPDPSSPLLGHYRLLREAGRGGMSVVYEAVDDRIGRRVALKVMSAPHSLSPDQRGAMIARFNREARAIARLSHPNIVSIYDIGEEDGRQYIVMEFLEGITLRERLDDGPVPPAEASAILDQVAGGLDAVHAAGIVHRDIKPSNVMLLPGGRVKLMDFGVARQHEDTLVTQAGMMVGSPAYMSPEQINSTEHSAASDVWSLGVVLYEMLAGRLPFAGGSIPNVVYQVTRRPPSPLPRDVSGVQRVINRVLDKSPTGRYKSARALADAFRATLPPPPQTAPSPRAPRPAETSPRPAPPTPRRVRLAALAGGLGLALLLLAPLLALRLRHTPPPGAAVAARAHSKIAPSRAVRLARGVPHHVPHRSASPRPRPVHPAVKRLVVAMVAAPHRLRLAPPPALPVTIAEVTPRSHSVPERRVAPLTKPIIRVASSRQERFFVPTPRPAHPVRRAPRPPVRQAAQPHHPPRTRKPVVPDVPREEPTPTVREAVTVPPRPAPAKQPDTVVATSGPETTGSVQSVHFDTPKPRADTPKIRAAQAGPNLLGTWHGRHSHNPATLVITRRDGDRFTGTMSVRTHEASVRIAVEGHVSPRTGAVSMRETRVLSSSQPHAWDLGSESGRVLGGGHITGTGTDIKGRSGAWSFSR